MKVVLASGSPTRKELLRKWQVSFVTCVADIDESPLAGESLEQQVERLAIEKAQTVLPKYKDEKDLLILAFDSLVAVDGDILGKPKTKKAAFEMFQKYVGKKVDAFSGVCLAGNWKGKPFQTSFVEKSWIHFRDDTTNCQIRAFLEFNDWKGKAGGITVEGPCAFLIDRIEGDFPNVLGVPVIRIGEELRTLFGTNPIKILPRILRKEVE